MQGERLAKILRFGDFEFDLEAREFQRHGRSVRVHEQPLRILNCC